METQHRTENYSFWDLTVQWARESFQPEHVIAKTLAIGVLRDGLGLKSLDPEELAPDALELRGAPFVGYVAREGKLPIFIRAPAFKHLRDVAENAAAPEPQMLAQEFISRHDFRVWLHQRGIEPPAFWFATGDAQLT
jgi:hypothetical protein